MDLGDSRGVEAAREGPYLTMERHQRARSGHERKSYPITQTTFNVSGNSPEMDDKQVLPAGVVGDHELDFLAGLTLDGCCRRCTRRVGWPERPGLDAMLSRGAFPADPPISGQCARRSSGKPARPTDAPSPSCIDVERRGRGSSHLRACERIGFWSTTPREAQDAG